MARAPQASRASAARVAYHVNKLGKMLARSDDISFLQLIWATDALQSDRVAEASAFITYPPQATDSSIGSPFAIYRWELETLVIQLFLTAKQEIHEGPNFILNCSKFDSIREVVNRLRSLENVEYGFYIAGGTFDIFSEMHRIAQRQFHWQRGYFSLQQFYRYLFVYGQGQCAQYFRERYGLTPSEFALAAFAYFVTYQRTPWIGLNEVPEIGLTHAILGRALPMMSVERAEARARSAADVARINQRHGRPLPTAYLPSVLRRSPLIFQQENPNRFIAPIPEIILMRTTSGLYYDLVGCGQALLNEANERFEQYCARYISTMMRRFEIGRSFRYGPHATQTDSPDVLVKDDGRVVLMVECKATKLTYLAQFAEDPFVAEQKQYQQISRGIFQLWRFFSHIRRGVTDLQLAPNISAMVLTLDPFGIMDRELRASIFSEAERLANQENNITAEDRRHIILCPIAELEQVLHTSNEDSFLESLQSAQQERYIDWQFREIHRDTEAGRNFGAPRQFPFDLGEILPWWAAMQQLEIERAAQQED